MPQPEIVRQARMTMIALMSTGSILSWQESGQKPWQSTRDAAAIPYVAEIEVIGQKRHAALSGAGRLAFLSLSRNWAMTSRLSEAASTTVPIALTSGVMPRLIDEKM